MSVEVGQGGDLKLTHGSGFLGPISTVRGRKCPRRSVVLDVVDPVGDGALHAVAQALGLRQRGVALEPPGTHEDGTVAPSGEEDGRGSAQRRGPRVAQPPTRFWGS